MTITTIEKSIKLHPYITGIRNKRQRMRMVRKYRRQGIRYFMTVKNKKAQN